MKPKKIVPSEPRRTALRLAEIPSSRRGGPAQASGPLRPGRIVLPVLSLFDEMKPGLPSAEETDPVGREGHDFLQGKRHLPSTPLGDRAGDAQLGREGAVGDQDHLPAGSRVGLFPGQSDERPRLVEVVADRVGIDLGLGDASLGGQVERGPQDFVSRPAGFESRAISVLEAVALGHQGPHAGRGVGLARPEDVSPFGLVRVVAEIADARVALDEIAPPDDGLGLAELGLDFRGPGPDPEPGPGVALEAEVRHPLHEMVEKVLRGRDARSDDEVGKSLGDEGPGHGRDMLVEPQLLVEQGFEPQDGQLLGRPQPGGVFLADGRGQLLLEVSPSAAQITPDSLMPITLGSRSLTTRARQSHWLSFFALSQARQSQASV